MNQQDLKKYLLENGINESEEILEQLADFFTSCIDHLKAFHAYIGPLDNNKTAGLDNRLNDLLSKLGEFRTFVGYPLFNKVINFYPEIPFFLVVVFLKRINKVCMDTEDLCLILNKYPQYLKYNSITFSEFIKLLDCSWLQLTSSILTSITAYVVNQNYSPYEEIILKNTLKRLVEAHER